MYSLYRSKYCRKLSLLISVLLLSFSLTSVAKSPANTAVLTKPVLSLAMADTIADACIQHQIKTAYRPITVVVVDDGGLVLVVKRQDGACKACIDIAEKKARTAALFNRTTRVLEKIAFGAEKNGAGAAVPGVVNVPGVIAFPGGVPVVVNDVPIGGVGVSGASGDEDEQCALAGLAALKGE